MYQNTNKKWQIFVNCVYLNVLNMSIFIYTFFDVVALCQFVNKLRDEESCFCDHAQTSTIDNFNWTILVSFVDDTQWVFRFSRFDNSLKFEKMHFFVVNEIVTIRYIRINNTIFVFEMFAYKQVLFTLF